MPSMDARAVAQVMNPPLIHLEEAEKQEQQLLMVPVALRMVTRSVGTGPMEGVALLMVFGKSIIEER